jgi:hypothetical protein
MKIEENNQGEAQRPPDWNHDFMKTKNAQTENAGRCCPPPLGSAIGPFQVYEDYENGLHIIDGNTRVMLSDTYAYDADKAEKEARMEWIAQALSDAWQAQQTGDNMPLPNTTIEARRDAVASGECSAAANNHKTPTP